MQPTLILEGETGEGGNSGWAAVVIARTSPVARADRCSLCGVPIAVAILRAAMIDEA